MRQGRPYDERGYVALMAVLIVGAAATAIGLTLLTTAMDQGRAALVTQQSAQARDLADACGEGLYSKFIPVLVLPAPTHFLKAKEAAIIQ